jgi:NAD(P)-dependent dehydrogenase (short-subunit alcohol dehydrogenase family)
MIERHYAKYIATALEDLARAAVVSLVPRSDGNVVPIGKAFYLKDPTDLQWSSDPAMLEMQTIAYNTSKGAVVNFTRSLAGGWGRYGITVNALAPGMFPSKMTNGTIDQVGIDKLTAGVPLQRIGDEEDLKGAAVLFASDAGKHITGQILCVDGGLTAVLSAS